MENNELIMLKQRDVTGKKILIADDDRTTHIKFRKFLTTNGFEIFNAYDGAAAYSIHRLLNL